MSAHRNGTGRASILDGEPLPDVVKAPFERVELRVMRAVVATEDRTECEQSEDPAMALDPISTTSIA